MADCVNLVKLCVGADSVDDLLNWQQAHFTAQGRTPAHVTRMRPKRAAALLNGGSLYWVFKGLILARQPVLGLEDRVGQDGITRCAILLSPDVVLCAPTPRRAFQGWRYLEAKDSPRDLPATRKDEAPLPAELAAKLNEIGLR